MMTLDQKLDFVHKQTKLALQHVQHFDTGGTALSGPATTGTNNATDPNTSGIAGTIGGIMGTNNNFQATGANIQQGTNTAQLNQAYAGAQGALNQATNQSNVLNQGLNQGANTQSNLSNQLQAESLGQGPNPAQAALNQNTGQNISQQAALAASTRGAGANAGLVGQNAANTGAALQQTAVGQEATQAAQQQLNAQNSLQNLAATQVGQGASATQLANQTQQNEQNILQGANTAANNAAVSQQQNINTTNAATSAANQNAAQQTAAGIGSALNQGGDLISSLFAKGGKVHPHLKATAMIYHPQHFDDGGEAWQNDTPVTSDISGGPSATLPAYTPPQQGKSGGGGGGGAAGLLALLAEGGQAWQPSAPVNSTISGGPSVNLPQYIPPAPSQKQKPKNADSTQSDADVDLADVGSGIDYYRGGKTKNFKKGGDVPGKPKIGHDDYGNDTVAAKLSPGEVVMDLNTLKDKGKLGQMARFVAKEIERKKAGRKLA